MQVEINDILFRDILFYTSRTNLSSFLVQWNITETKSVWPHSFYSSIEQIRSDKIFPQHSSFWSKLKNTNVPYEDWLSAKNEFERRKNLPKNHPDRWNSMLDHLRFYNSSDTRPLLTAIEKLSKNFHELFRFDPLTVLSLPSLAFR